MTIKNINGSRSKMWLISKKFCKYHVIVLSSFVLLLYSFTIHAQTNYLWPIIDSDKYGKFLTSTFAESRTDRFHAGIDIKTIWKEGHQVVAVDDGFLYQLRVSPFGYGKAVYLQLQDGRIVVYGHLSRFAPKFQEMIEEEQEKQNSYSVDIWFSPGEVPVKRGEVLATTGRSGTRLQHLHFELRDNNNRPLNPLANGFSAEDIMAPRPTKLCIRPMNVESHVEGDWQPVIKTLNNGKNGVFTVANPIPVWGDIGISVDAYDRNGTYENNYGVYSMKLMVNGREYFSAKFGHYSYYEDRLVNLDRDYRLLRRDKGKFQKLYLEQGNTLPFYGDYRQGDGIVSLRDAGLGKVPFEVIVADYAGNETIIQGNFDVQQFKQEQVFPVSSPDSGITRVDLPDRKEKPRAEFRITQDFQDDYLRIEFMSNRHLVALPAVTVEKGDSIIQQLETRAKSRRDFVAAVPLTDIENKQVRFHIVGESSTHYYEIAFPVEVYRVTPESNNVQLPSNAGNVAFMPGNLYKDIWLRYNVENTKDQNGRYDIVSEIVHLEPKETVLRSDIYLTLHYPPQDPKPDKLGIYARDNVGEWHYIGQNRNMPDHSISVNLSSLETVSVIRDTVPPAIWRISPRDGADITNKKPEIAAWFDDQLSGIAGESRMGLYLDGKKIIAEWDPILKKIFFIPKQDLTPGEHTARFVVNDQMDNTAERTWNFTIR